MKRVWLCRAWLRDEDVRVLMWAGDVVWGRESDGGFFAGEDDLRPASAGRRATGLNQGVSLARMVFIGGPFGERHVDNTGGVLVTLTSVAVWVCQ